MLSLLVQLLKVINDLHLTLSSFKWIKFCISHHVFSACLGPLTKSPTLFSLTIVAILPPPVALMAQGEKECTALLSTA